MGKIDFESRSDCRQGSVGGIEQGICGEIIHRSEPFPLEDAPKGLGNIKMWAIRREKEKEQPSLLPCGTKFPHKPAPVYTCVVKDYKVLLLIRSDIRSRKSATLSVVMFSVVVNPSYLFLRSIIPNILSRRPLSEGMQTSSPRNCHPYGTYPSVQI